MRHIYILLIILLLSINTTAQPKYEVRAVWLTTIGGLDWPHSYAQSERSIEKQKEELRNILNRLQAVGINTVLLQTRVRGTVIYPSLIEPWDGCLSGFPGKSPGYDALSFAIDECHKRGMELHAWVVTMPVGKWDGLGCKSIRNRMPGNIIRIKSEGYMNPESQQTASYLADLCAEITRNYDIDGIHLDYIRYPEELPKLKSLPRNIGRQNITRIVNAISQRVKSMKPWVKMSCSPIGKYDDTSRYWSYGWNANTTVCQDAEKWLRDGLMDELFPMMYFRDNNFFPFALDWKERSHGRIIAPGLGIYFMSPKERDWPLSDITRELEVLRHIGMGHAYFRSKFFTDDTKGIYTYAKDNYCQYPSLVPPMTWASHKRPAMPTFFRRKAAAHGTDLIEWQHRVKDSTMIMFNIYASKEYPVNTDNAHNLIAIRCQCRHLSVPANATLHYAITATDRYGIESEAIQEQAPSSSLTPHDLYVGMKLLQCDGKALSVPKQADISDTEFLVVETLQGTMVATLSHRRLSHNVNVTKLKNGVYRLRSLNSKGISHQLGIFIIKRDGCM